MAWDKVDVEGENIKNMIMDKDELDKFITPVCAFITFEDDDSHRLALEYTERIQKIAEKRNIKNKTQDTILNHVPIFT